MGSKITNKDLFSRLEYLGCERIQFDVAEMIAPESLWQLPADWEQLPSNELLLDFITKFANTCIIFVSETIIDGFAPTAIASAFRINGMIDTEYLFTDLQDKLLEGTLNEHVESRLLLHKPEYTCVQTLSMFSVPFAEQVLDFQSRTVFDLYYIEQGQYILLQRTVIAPQKANIPLPVFNDARPPE